MIVNNPQTSETLPLEPFGELLAKLSDRDIAEAAHSLLTLTTEDFAPYYWEFRIITTFTLGDIATGTGLSRNELETALDLPPATTYRYLTDCEIAPIISCEKPRMRDQFYDKRHRIYHLTYPSENPRLTPEEKKQFENLEKAIISILTSRKLFAQFLKEIGRGLSNPQTLDNALDNLSWIYLVLYDVYQGLLKVPNLEIKAGQRMNSVQQILCTMNLLFKNGRHSKSGRFVLQLYSIYWQSFGTPEPEFHGKKEIKMLLDNTLKPFIKNIMED